MEYKIPLPQQDRIHFPKLFLVVGICSFAGLGLTLWLSPEADETKPSRPNQTQPTPTTSKSSQVKYNAADSQLPNAQVPTRSAESTSQVAKPGAVRSQTDLEVHPRQPLWRIEQGRVAYLHCSIKQGNDPSNCPRDTVFEKQIWMAIDDLENCPTKPTAPGEADIRVHIQDGQANDIKLRGIERAGKPRLDGPAVLGCLRPKLRHITPSMPYQSLSVAFRFELLDGSNAGPGSGNN